MHIIIILKFFEKYKCSGIAFLQSSRYYVSKEQSCLKTTGLYDDLLFLASLFYFFYFIFSIPISFSLCSPISLLFLFDVLSQAFNKCSRKACVCVCVYICIYVYVYIYYTQMCIIYILENL